MSVCRELDARKAGAPGRWILDDPAKYPAKDDIGIFGEHGTCQAQHRPVTRLAEQRMYAWPQGVGRLWEVADLYLQGMPIVSCQAAVDAVARQCVHCAVSSQTAVLLLLLLLHPCFCLCALQLVPLVALLVVRRAWSST